MKQIVDGKLYDTETAEPIADNEFANGTNRLNVGRAQFLYKTKKGNFFVHYETIWQGEHDSIVPVPIDEAKRIYEQLCNQLVGYESAFGSPPEEA